MSIEGHEVDHLSVEDLAAYLDGALSASARARIEDHLESCDQCRAEASTAAGALSEYESGRRRARWPLFAAAAVVATLALLPLTSSFGPDVQTPVRSAPSEGTPTFPIEAPADGESLTPDAVVFRWSGPDDASSYELTVTNEAGDVLYSERTTVTSLALPADLELSEGRYYWVVDALLDRGRAATSGVHEFTLAR